MSVLIPHAGTGHYKQPATSTCLQDEQMNKWTWRNALPHCKRSLGAGRELLPLEGMDSDDANPQRVDGGVGAQGGHLRNLLRRNLYTQDVTSNQSDPTTEQDTFKAESGTAAWSQNRGLCNPSPFSLSGGAFREHTEPPSLL